jgi:hypothetical protein
MHPRTETLGMEREIENCTLRLAAQGRAEECPREACAFWEPGGAVVEGTCLIERLGIDLRQAELACYLLETRERLEQARDMPSRERRSDEARIACN